MLKKIRKNHDRKRYQFHFRYNINNNINNNHINNNFINQSIKIIFAINNTIIEIITINEINLIIRNHF